MHHVAIMSKKGKLQERILCGKKTIESRWYKTRRLPWDSVKKGDLIYFKDSGEPVTSRAIVVRVIQFEDLDHAVTKKIIAKYGSKISNVELSSFFNSVKTKKYCILMVIKDPTRVKPFNINKEGFGMPTAWLTVLNIKSIISRL